MAGTPTAYLGRGPGALEMAVTLWFNPRCGTARKVRAWLDDKKIDYELREYLKEPPTKGELADVLGKGGMQPSELLRAKEDLAAELGLRGSSDEEKILDAMAEHPVLINRPVVVDGDRARLCRPAETVADFFA